MLNYKDGLIQCERCGKWYSVLYPLQPLKAYVGCNGENDIDYQEHYEIHHICEDCYGDFLEFLNDKDAEWDKDKIIEEDLIKRGLIEVE